MIVDVCVTPPLPDVWQGLQNMPDHLEGYKDLYARTFASLNQTDFTPEGMLRRMDRAGVAVAVLHAEDSETTAGRRIPDEWVSDLVRRYPARFVGFAGVDPHKSRGAVSGLERAVKTLGLRGAMIGPWDHHMYADDRRYYPIYAACEELGIPIWIHTSINFARTLTMDYGHPSRLDRVAVDFPALKIIAGHGGWPWVAEMMAVAWRHPNIYLDFSAIRPKYIARPGSGWEALLYYGSTVLARRVLFGTAWPLIDMATAVEEVKALPLPPEVMELWLHENARSLLKLPPRERSDRPCSLVP